MEYRDVPVIGAPKCAVGACGHPGGAAVLNGKILCQFHGTAAIGALAGEMALNACPKALKVKRLRPDAILPHSAHPGEDAGLDLFSCSDITLATAAFAVIPCGVAIELWPGFEAQVRSRSGLAAKHGVFVLNSPGTVDSGYRGEISVILFNAGPKEYTVRKGDKIAQLVIAKFTPVEVQIADELNDTSRGGNGFGSTGA